MIALVEKLNSFSYTTAFSGIDAPGVDAVTREDFEAASISWTWTSAATSPPPSSGVVEREPRGAARHAAPPKMHAGRNINSGQTTATSLADLQKEAPQNGPRFPSWETS